MSGVPLSDIGRPAPAALTPAQEAFLRRLKAAQEKGKAAPFAGEGPQRVGPPLATLGVRG